MGVLSKALFAPFLLCVGLAASAQPSLPASIHTVGHAGYWQDNGRSGTYRLIVVNDGWEHVSSRMFVQWVAEPTSRDAEPQVIAVAEATLPKPASFDAKLRHLEAGRVEVVVAGVDTFDPNARVKATFVATSPGVLSLVRGSQ